MSIESNMKAIVANLDRIATALEQRDIPQQAAPAAVEPAPIPTVETVAPGQVQITSDVATPAAPATQQPPAAPVAPVAQPQQAAPVAAPAANAVTIDQLNQVLVTEFGRLGGREQIDQVTTQYGGPQISDISPEHYQTIIQQVQALKVQQ